MTRALNPIDRISEVLFGLIMVRTFTGSLSIAEAGREDTRTMLVGALGCNLAWGIIDGMGAIQAFPFLTRRSRFSTRPSGGSPTRGRSWNVATACRPRA